MKNRPFLWRALGVAGITLALSPTLLDACTRLVYHGPNGQFVTARSMDFATDIPTDLWILPRGIERNGETGPNSIRWTSKHGSVIASGFGASTTDGVNEAGLNANLLWLVESEYPKFDANAKPGLSLAAWAQYMLDNFATVAEAVEALRREPFTVVTDTLPGQKRLTTVHLSLSDATGDSAIVEYLGGKQVIHHDRRYQVMTNSPTYDQQLALNAYWSQIGGRVMLPGTNRAADRFVRASFYVNSLPKSDDPNVNLASVFGVIRNTSVPYGFTTPEEPNISSTLWRVVIDHQRRLYFFESALSPNTFWVDLKKIDFSKETGVAKKLDLGDRQSRVYAGDATGSFTPAKPFRFLGLSR